MKKRSPLSTILLLIVVIGSAYALYRWVYKPMMARRTMEQALDKGCVAVAEKFEEQREEIAEDLKNLLEKIEQQEKIEEVAAEEPAEEPAK